MVSAPAPVAVARDDRWATAAYVAPFAAYVGCLGLQQLAPGASAWLLVFRTVLVTAILATISRRVIPLRPVMPASSIAFGVVLFAVWVGPDWLWPGFRGHWLFSNGITGRVASSVPAAVQADYSYVAWRVASSVLLVPILEELFWRGWVMRWLVKPSFREVPLGTYTAASFWIAAAMFAVEHGPYWDVGLLAGIGYNWWLVRTRNLADCILAHAVTNGCLAAYVLLRGEWQFWL
ncbi:MAG TPA: CAAX prenyl protease-related protein [Bryobacteraceae bacterium]|nr:CAAX prenyl protease-related protein [Bryobacteraceae bacterium]